MKLSILLVLSVLATAHGYRLFCVQSLPSRSHYNLVAGVVRPLLDAGHEVTLITIYPDKKPSKNLTIIDMSVLQGTIDNINVLNAESTSFTAMMKLVAGLTATILKDPKVRHVLINENFDAVITEWFFTDTEAGYAATLQVPWIMLHPELTPHMENVVDTVRSLSTIPSPFNIVPIPMTLGQRLTNTLMYTTMSLAYMKDYAAYAADYEMSFGAIAKARGVTLPPFAEAVRNISVLFLNSHPSFTPARSLPPNAVEIGGYHIDEKIPPLPKDLQELLDSSKNGVIYFSMGSVIKSKDLPEATKQDLVKLFGELPYTVLWKFEAKMDNLPKNLHVRPWMPQTSILSHPNVKVFITHGGGLSTIESLYFGKPILSIPVYGDQPINADKSVRAGRGLQVTFSPDMTGELRVALKEMLNNDSYYKRSQYLSAMFHKRPVSPAKLIQNYVELAIESKGAYHLRSKTHLYEWYEVWMLDQAAVLLVVLYVIYRILKKLLTVVTGMFSKKVKTQ